MEKKNTVFLANNSVVVLYRTWADKWIWDTGRMTSFHTADGTRVSISKHWLIGLVEGEANGLDFRSKSN